MISKKFLALAAVLCALALVPVAVAAGVTATATPSHPRLGHNLQLKVTGLKPGEKVKAVELIADGSQKTTYYPKQRANSTGLILVTVKAQVLGKHTWTFTGRTSHRTATTHYAVVK